MTGTYKVYAVDAAGNLSGASVYNVTIVSGLVDIDGNVYSTVVIGTQNWMAENLKVTKYRNGDNITNITITNNSDWTYDTSGAYGYYNDNTTLRDTYGMLYNWYAVDNSSGLCPEGWQVPTNAEFTVLYDYLENIDSKVGGQLKETGTDHWQSESSGTSNSSGFTARGAGYRHYNIGNYGWIKQYTHTWSVTPSGSNAYYHRLRYNSDIFGEFSTHRAFGFSVRCLED